MPSHRTHCHRRSRGSLPALVLMSLLLASLPGARVHAICKGSPAGYEFVAALYDSNLQCGGTVLPGGWILTAAHCGKMLTAGFHGRTGRFTIAECYRHPDYTGGDTLENDVAMIRLDSPPAGLQSLPLVDAGWTEAALQQLTIAGRGGCSDNLSQTLLDATVLTFPVGLCQARYAPPMSNRVIDPAENLCTGVIKSHVFNADSGGPVIVKVNDQLQLAGVISVGVAPTSGWMMLPDRHTRVTDYLTWIQQVKDKDKWARSRPCGT